MRKMIKVVRACVCKRERILVRIISRIREVETSSTAIAWYILLYMQYVLTSCWHYYTLRNLLSHTHNHTSIIGVTCKH